MKNFTRSLYFIILLLAFSKPIGAQGWEILVSDPIFNSVTSDFQAISGPGDGVRLIYKEYLAGEPALVWNYDSNGEFIGNDGIPGTDNWNLIQSDNSGASYWWNFQKIRKLNADSQIEWTYDVSIIISTFEAFKGPNGSTYILYSSDFGDDAIDIVDKGGELVHRFIFDDWVVAFLPTNDYGLIYTYDFSDPTEKNWTKLDSEGNEVWTRNFGEFYFILGGGSDGSTYFIDTNDEIIKIDSAENVIWTKHIETSNYSYSPLIELSDGNLALFTSGNDNSLGDFIEIEKINPQNGDLIWKKRSIPLELSLPIGFFEMSDGGLLAAAECYPSVGGRQIFMMRTDADGNTFTNQIKGTIYWDENSDCQWQNTEETLKQTSIIAQSGTKTFSATTDAQGNFSMNVGSGNYQISYGQLGSYWDFCNSPALTLATENDTVVFNAGAITLADCPELVVSVGSNVFRRCFDNNYLHINYQNIGTAPAENAYIDLLLDPQLEFLSSSPVAATQVGSVYRFELGTLDINESGQITVNFKVDCDAEMGAILCVNAQIHPDTSCLPVLPRSTENTFCLPVVASYDPNDKTAFIDGKPETTKILPNQPLEYLIRFQNTGNDTAFNIVILDTLTSYLNATSVLPGASSHPYTFELVKGHILKFSFRNILLPDSNTNEVASHGFIKFSVLQNATNAIGDQLKNSAAIYFDYNDPIITNETNLQISVPSRTNDVDNRVAAQIFPVPAHDKAQVIFNDTHAGTVIWRLSDGRGQLVSSGQSSAATVFDIPRKGLPSGIYYCQFLLENGQNVFGKVIFD